MMRAVIDLTVTDELLTTTRAVRRRLDLDRPVERELLLECISIAQQAPTGVNSQGWGFLVVTDAAKRARLAELYREAVGDSFTASRERALRRGDEQTAKAYAGATYLADVLHRVPVHVIPCIRGSAAGADPLNAAAAGLYGSVLPPARGLAA